MAERAATRNRPGRGHAVKGEQERTAELIEGLRETDIEAFMVVARHRYQRGDTACASKETLISLADIGDSLQTLRKVFIEHPKGISGADFVLALVSIGDALTNFRHVVTFFPHEPRIERSGEC